MRLETLKVLSDGEIRRIHESSLDILEHCGIMVPHQRLHEALRKKGAIAEGSSPVVRFPRAMVEEALSHVPPAFEVFDRAGSPAFVLGDGVSKIAAGHNAINWVDTATGTTRPSRIADVELAARICQQLECIDMVAVPVMPQDGPDPQASLLYGLGAVIRNTTKPVYFSTDNRQVNRACISLLEAAFEGDLRSRVYGISQFSPTSPLSWEATVLDAVIDMIDTGVPICFLPEPIAGVSAPYTLAGLLTVHNVECLSGLVISQMLRPGCKVMYGSSWTTADMHTGAALVGSTETTLCRIAVAQIGRFYKVPVQTTAPNSDNHAHDEQNAWEKTFSQFCAVAAGNDLIVNCGMFATGMTFSHEQLILDEEITAMSRRIARGIEVTPETVAAHVVKEIGQGGNYLTSEHTLTWLRSGEYVEPRVSVRGPYALWAAAGALDAVARARAEAGRISAASQNLSLDAHRARAMDEIISSFGR